MALLLLIVISYGSLLWSEELSFLLRKLNGWKLFESNTDIYGYLLPWNNCTSCS
jgi:hypothetical protein